MKQLLWNFINRIWRPKHWKGTTEAYIRAYYPEQLLLWAIFDGRRRFLYPEWWWMKVVAATLHSGTHADQGASHDPAAA